MLPADFVPKLRDYHQIRTSVGCEPPSVMVPVQSAAAPYLMFYGDVEGAWDAPYTLMPYRDDQVNF